MTAFANELVRRPEPGIAVTLGAGVTTRAARLFSETLLCSLANGTNRLYRIGSATPSTTAITSRGSAGWPPRLIQAARQQVLRLGLDKQEGRVTTNRGAAL